MRTTTMIVEILTPGIIFIAALLLLVSLQGGNLITDVLSIFGDPASIVLGGGILFLSFSYLTGTTINVSLYWLLSQTAGFRPRLLRKAFQDFGDEQVEILRKARTHLNLTRDEGPDAIPDAIKEEIILRATLFVMDRSQTLDTERVFHRSAIRLCRGCWPGLILLGIDIVLNWTILPTPQIVPKHIGIILLAFLVSLIALGLWVVRDSMLDEYRTTLRSFLILTRSATQERP